MISDLVDFIARAHASQGRCGIGFHVFHLVANVKFKLEPNILWPGINKKRTGIEFAASPGSISQTFPDVMAMHAVAF